MSYADEATRRRDLHVDMIARQLQLNAVDADLLEVNLDLVLRWLGDKPTDVDVAEVAQKAEMSLEDFRGRLFLQFDQAMFGSADPSGDAARLFAGRREQDADSAKRRFRHLVGVYHPDRQMANTVLLLDRTRRVNVAYEVVKQRSGRSPTSVHEPDMRRSSRPAAAHQDESSAQQPRFKGSRRREAREFEFEGFRPGLWLRFVAWLRQHVGGGNQLARLVVIGGLTVSALLVMLIALPLFFDASPTATPTAAQPTVDDERVLIDSRSPGFVDPLPAPGPEPEPMDYVLRPTLIEP